MPFIGVGHCSTARDILTPFAYPISAEPGSYDPILKAVGNAQVILIGCGSRGTYNCYAHRAALTRRLIEEKGFNAVAVEADWPAAYEVNRFIHGRDTVDGKANNAYEALNAFDRCPKWMWKHEVMLPFVEYLRQHNERVTASGGESKFRRNVSFYGLDLFSLHESMQLVLDYLYRVDPDMASETRKRYNCFEKLGEEATSYSLASQFGLDKTCEKEVIDSLRDLVLRSHQCIVEQLARDAENPCPGEERFIAEMNALAVQNSEKYYRTLMSEDELSWNTRDGHFAMVLQRILKHLSTQKPAKIVVWAHNSHIGDARSTDMGLQRGEINLGQRARELFGDDNVYNVGFLTSRGTVTAADSWDSSPELYTVNPPIYGSIERLLTEARLEDHIIFTHRIKSKGGENTKVRVDNDVIEFLNRDEYGGWYQRFIGVVYKPHTERRSHYVKCRVGNQYDCILQIGGSKARGIVPLEKGEAV